MRLARKACCRAIGSHSLRRFRQMVAHVPRLRKVQLSYEARAWPKMSLDETKIERRLQFLNVELLNGEEVCFGDGNVDGH